MRGRFDRGLIEAALSHAPASFTLHARNPARDLAIGANHITFATVGSAPDVSDLERGRRVGNFEDYCDLIRLAQAFNIVHFMGGYPVEPLDLQSWRASPACSPWSTPPRRCASIRR